MEILKSTFKPFLKYLTQQKEKIAYLQLIGRLEEYLVKEFCYYVFLNSKGKELAVINMGSNKEQKIDICILSGENLDDPEIKFMIEAKYFRNKHRFRLSLSATDEITTTLKSLNSQMHNYNSETHGWFKVSPYVKKIFGLIFISYISEEKNIQEKEKYFQRIIKTAKENLNNLKVLDNMSEDVYDDIEVNLINKT
ncbi:hypothetical protein LCGC14_3083500, partial [marine sediment metagenome]